MRGGWGPPGTGTAPSREEGGSVCSTAPDAASKGNIIKGLTRPRVSNKPGVSVSCCRAGGQRGRPPVCGGPLGRALSAPDTLVFVASVSPPEPRHRPRHGRVCARRQPPARTRRSLSPHPAGRREASEETNRVGFPRFQVRVERLPGRKRRTGLHFFFLHQTAISVSSLFKNVPHIPRAESAIVTSLTERSAWSCRQSASAACHKPDARTHSPSASLSPAGR